MADFDFAFAFMGPHEWNQKNNFTNDPSDPGGATKWGITFRAWASRAARRPDDDPQCRVVWRICAFGLQFKIG